MATHNAKLRIPHPNDTVLLVHVFDDPELEPACSTGYVDDSGAWQWDSPALYDEDLEVHWWLDLPLLPATRPAEATDLRIEVESSITVRICRGGVLLTRAPVDRQGFLPGFARGLEFTPDETVWLIGECRRAIDRHWAERPGPVKRAWIRFRNRLLGSHQDRVTGGRST